jgi:membrane protease YdiL (CAAX protease family)
MHATRRENLMMAMFGLMFPLTFVIFRSIVSWTGVQVGYWLSMSVYWVIIVSFTLFNIGTCGIRLLFRVDKSVPQWWGCLAFIPAVATFCIAFLPSFFQLKAGLMLLTIVTGIINGTCEELFWRGLTLSPQVKNPRAIISASLTGFSLWHLSLTGIAGLQYQGGNAALVGGAFFMGILWQFVAMKTRNIRYVTIAHILVNIFAFSVMILENWQ